MAKENNLKDFLTDVADAIREKEGSTGLINPQDFSAKIRAIETGGGGETPTPDMPVIGDGKTYLYIRIAEKGRMVVPLYFSQTAANGVTIDWGDGSATQKLSGTGNKNTTHTYAGVGEYTISLNPTGGCTLGLGNSMSYCVMGSTGNNGKVYCNMLQAVEIGANTIINNYAFYNCQSLTSVVMPQGVKSIGTAPFYFCYSLKSIVIPQGITDISSNAFYSCHSLESIVIPQSVTSLGGNLCYGCGSLKSIVIPQGVTSIETYSFYNCYSLKSIVIPQSVTSIGTYAFQKCYSLESIVIPNRVTSIKNSAFYDCHCLKSIVIPQGVTNIGASAFYNCYSLASIVIPQSVTTISNNAFTYCYGMAYYDFSQCTSIPTLGGTAVFSNIPSDCKIVVPDALYDDWRVATNWSTHSSKIVKASAFNG